MGVDIKSVTLFRDYLSPYGVKKRMNEILEVLDREDFINNPDHFKDIVQASYNEEERYRRLKNETKEHVHKMTLFKGSLLILIDKI